MMRRVPCPDENLLVRFGRGELDATARSEVELHLDVCGECRRVAAAITLASGAAPASPTTTFQPGDQLGRFEIERILGAGAMGVVYAAHDPQLGRRVALKVIHPALSAELAPEEVRARFLREAQAMAKLSHPNVVSVFDLGTHRGELFVAMELSEGVTLDVWRRMSRRSVRELVSIFIEAGKGLAAAHRAGIVHRDFKPHNVLVDPDGRVRVTDFGLSRQEHAPSAPAAPQQDVAVGATRTGHLLGTPGYMAPEQFEGRADERSDQFAFAVALYEAVAGVRPFDGRTVGELQVSLRAGTLPKRPAAIPPWLHAVLARALSRDPVARFASMDELLRVLKRGGGRHRFAVAATIAVALGLIAAGSAYAIRPASAVTSAPVEMSLAAGESKSLPVPNLRRLAVGDPSIAEATQDGDDRVRVTGRSAGGTTLLAWDQGGVRHEWTVHVTSAREAGATTADENAVANELELELELEPGERRRLDLGTITRLAIGAPEIAEPSVGTDGRVELLARAPGTTTLLVWTRDGSRREVRVQVAAPAP